MHPTASTRQLTQPPRQDHPGPICDKLNNTNCVDKIRTLVLFWDPLHVGSGQVLLLLTNTCHVSDVVAQASHLRLGKAFYRAMAPKRRIPGTDEDMSEEDYNRAMLAAVFKALGKHICMIDGREVLSTRSLAPDDNQEEKTPMDKEAENAWNQVFDHIIKLEEAGVPFADQSVVDIVNSWEYKMLPEHQNGELFQLTQNVPVDTEEESAQADYGKPAKYARTSTQTPSSSSSTQATATTSATELQVDAPIDKEAE